MRKPGRITRLIPHLQWFIESLECLTLPINSPPRICSRGSLSGVMLTLRFKNDHNYLHGVCRLASCHIIIASSRKTCCTGACDLQVVRSVVWQVLRDLPCART